MGYIEEHDAKVEERQKSFKKSWLGKQIWNKDRDRRNKELEEARHRGRLVYEERESRKGHSSGGGILGAFGNLARNAAENSSMGGGGRRSRGGGGGWGGPVYGGGFGIEHKGPVYTGFGGVGGSSRPRKRHKPVKRHTPKRRSYGGGSRIIILR